MISGPSDARAASWLSNDFWPFIDGQLEITKSLSNRFLVSELDGCPERISGISFCAGIKHVTSNQRSSKASQQMIYF